MNPFLTYFLLLGLAGVAGFVLSVRDLFKAERQPRDEELSDYLHNDWLRAKNWICYGRDK